MGKPIQLSGNVAIGDFTGKTERNKLAQDITNMLAYFSNVIPAGASFPESPEDKQLFYRTDLYALYIYDTNTWRATGDPPGSIKMWSGTLATIPAGWVLCDGNNGTPNLQDKFIYGNSSGVNPGDTGGATTHSHTVNSHTHKVDPPSTATGAPGADSWAYENAGGTKAFYDTHTHNVDITEFDSGGATPGTNAPSHLPPYYKLAFIMKT